MGTDRKSSDHKQERKHWLHEEQRMMDQAGNESQLIFHIFQDFSFSLALLCSAALPTLHLNP